MGGSEAIDIAMRAMLNPGEEVLILSQVLFPICHVVLWQAVSQLSFYLKEEDEFKLTKQAAIGCDYR